MSTEQKILAVLEGCSSAKPMPFDTLLAKTMLQAATLSMVLAQMPQSIPATINHCLVIKAGKSQHLFWPTGVIASSTGPQGIVINPYHPSRQFLTQRHVVVRAEKVQPNTSHSEQESSMNQKTEKRGGQPSELNKCIYNKIVGHPGIAHAALIGHAQKECPDATEKQIVKTISNMRHVTKKIRAEGERGHLSYHLNNGAVAPAPKPRKPVGKVVTGAAAAALRNDPAEAAHVESDTNTTHSTSKKADDLDIFIDDRNNLCLSTSHIDLELNPAQTARLHAFMRRVQLELPA